MKKAKGQSEREMNGVLFLSLSSAKSRTCFSHLYLAEWKKKEQPNYTFLFFCLIHAYIVIKQKEQRTNHLSSSLPVILCCVIWRKKGKCNARFLFFISHTTIPISFSLNWIKRALHSFPLTFIHFKQRNHTLHSIHYKILTLFPI